MASNYEIAIKREYLVVKSNNLIQKTRYVLNAQQHKIILFIVSKIKESDDELKMYELDIKELCDICGLDSNGKNYANFKDSLQALAQKSFWINTPEKDMLVRWFERLTIHKENNKATKVSLRLDDRLRPYLLNLKQYFTSYEIINVLAMRSKYSIRLYELFKSYANLGSLILSVEELRKLTECSDKYKEYRRFRIRVIDTAIEEINSYSDILVNYTQIKNGKRIVRIKFEIEKKDINDKRKAAFLVTDILDGTDISSIVEGNNYER